MSRRSHSFLQAIRSCVVEPGLLFGMYLPRRLWLSRILKSTANLKTRGRKIIVILSSDTEFDPPSGSSTWKNRPTRALLDGLPRFLEVCDLYGGLATFFCEGKLVQDLPDLFRDLARGHEIGCHSFAHEWLGTQPPPQMIHSREEHPVLTLNEKARVLRQATESIESVVGRKPKSFRAPFASLDHPSTLFLLQQIGFDADSSLTSRNRNGGWLFNSSLAASFPRHASERDLWCEGEMHLVEVPITISPLPLFLNSFHKEVLMETVFRGIKLALESVDIQCRIDSLLGRDLSVVHINSHPWEFSEIKRVHFSEIVPWGGQGKANADRLSRFLSELSALYDVKFLTVGGFVRMWESNYCRLHSGH